MKVNIITLGCSKNVVDSEKTGGKLRQAGFEVVFDSNARDCDVILVNTCGFIGDAKEESVNTLLEQVAIKQRGRRQRRIIAVGCLIQRYKADLQREIPEIDAFYGTHEWDKIVEDLVAGDREQGTGDRGQGIGDRGQGTRDRGQGIGYKEEKNSKLLTPNSKLKKAYAFLKIAEGCNRSCSYCAIPLIRGPFVSRPMDELVAEAKVLVEQGAKEIIVIAQDTTYYGIDLYKKRMLGPLLERLSTETGAHWIRLHYTFPTDFPKDAIEVMRRYDNICNYIDIPLQHISTPILHSMQRGIDREGTLRLLEHFRHELPDAAIRTTLIVGYPGETEKEYEELQEFVRQARFDRMGVFAYSREEDTPAYPLGDPVSEEEKQRRVSDLMAIQEEISLEKNRTRIGQVCEVLIDRREGDFFVGRSQYDSPEVDDEILIPANRRLKCGGFYHVRITQAYENDLLAEVISR